MIFISRGQVPYFTTAEVSFFIQFNNDEFRIDGQHHCWSDGRFDNVVIAVHVETWYRCSYCGHVLFKKYVFIPNKFSITESEIF